MTVVFQLFTGPAQNWIGSLNREVPVAGEKSGGLEGSHTAPYGTAVPARAPNPPCIHPTLVNEGPSMVR